MNLASLTNKIVGSMEITDDEDERMEDDSFYDSDYREEEERGGFLNRLGFFKKDNVDDDYYDDVAASRKITKFSSARGNKRMKTRIEVVKPVAIDDAKKIVDYLKSGSIVFLNLQGVNDRLSQRLIDFSSGAVYSMAGNISMINNTIAIIMPESVDISGDFNDMHDLQGFDKAVY